MQNKYNRTPDNFDRSVAGMQVGVDNLSKPIYQKNIKNVLLEPLMTGSPQTLSPGRKDQQDAKVNIENISMLGRKGNSSY